MDAALFIARENAIAAEDVESVTVRTYEVAAKMTAGKEITTPLSGKMSLPYCTAAAVVDGQVGLDQFAPEKLTDPTILNLMEKIDVQSDGNLNSLVPDHRGARVEIRMNDGKKYEKEVLDAMGEPENPGTMDDQLNKFKDCTSGILDNSRLDELIDRIQHLEDIDDLSQVAELLKK